MMKGEAMVDPGLGAVRKARTPFGMFLDVMDFRLVAVDGKPEHESEPPCFLRIDSHGRMFHKGPETDMLWERFPKGMPIFDVRGTPTEGPKAPPEVKP